jgi:hypothetical protein
MLDRGMHIRPAHPTFPLSGRCDLFLVEQKQTSSENTADNFITWDALSRNSPHPDCSCDRPYQRLLTAKLYVLRSLDIS